MAQKKQKRKQVAKRAKAYGKVKYTQPGEAAFYKEVAKRERFVEKYSKSKYSKADLEKLKKTYGKAARAKVAKKSVAKKGIARAVGRAVGRVTPAAVLGKLAHDVMRAGSKKGCIERGGEWVGSGMKGRCKVAKKTKKTGGPDPRFAKSRRTKSKK